MPETVKKLILTLIFGTLLFVIAPTALADELAPSPQYIDLPVTVDTVKVGLRSGGSAVAEANISNKVGSGFKLGYFDYLRQFHKLGSTSVTDLTLRPDTGFVLTDGTKVGPWHIILNKEFSGFDSAAEYAKTLWGGFPAYIDGQYRVMVGAYADSSKAQAAITKRKLNGEPFTGGEHAILAAQTGTSELQLLIDVGDKTALAVKPVSKSKSAQTWFAGNAYYGSFEFICNNQALTVINYVSLEAYVKGVLPYEMNGNWPSEALKAQAACARTYALNNINSYIDRGFDVRNDTYSQVYRGITGTTESTNKASSDTSGNFVRYKGALCKVYYMSSDGGATDSSANVFSQKRAYLCGVKDNNEKDIDFYNKTWKSELTSANILYRLSTSGYELKDIKSIAAQRSELGIVYQLDITDSAGNTVTLMGEDCFRVLGLNSLNFTVVCKENEAKEKIWTFNGKGWGHNCGMSQWGAYAMASDDSVTCDDIIDFYFSGAYLA